MKTVDILSNLRSKYTCFFRSDYFCGNEWNMTYRGWSLGCYCSTQTPSFCTTYQIKFAVILSNLLKFTEHFSDLFLIIFDQINYNKFSINLTVVMMGTKFPPVRRPISLIFLKFNFYYFFLITLRKKQTIKS